MFKYYGKNIRPFTAVNQCNFGRKVIFTNKSKITKLNIVEELNKDNWYAFVCRKDK